MVRIKVCGITNLEDALLCVRLGVHALGFVFHPTSPRKVDLPTSARIIQDLPVFVSKVAVVTREDEDLLKRLKDVGFDTFQLYFDPSDSVRAMLRGAKLIRAMSLVQVAKMGIPKGYSALLLDASTKDMPGGTGTTIDWDMARKVVEEADLPVILAGGLTPENVAEAINRVRPYGVDVASGLEREAGIKDEKKVADFVARVLSAV